MLQTIHTKQLIKSDIETVWAFISAPTNLAKITPPYMGFNILSENDISQKMYAGQIIEYTVKPLLGISMHWVTEITHVEHLRYFVDEQRFGPYSFWHHKHFLTKTADGILMEDLVHYKLPLGLIGQLALPLVKKQLNNIFDYRYKKIDSLFNKA